MDAALEQSDEKFNGRHKTNLKFQRLFDDG